MTERIVSSQSLLLFDPWRSPNFVQAVASVGDLKGTFAVRDIPEDVLDRLAQAWLGDLYEKAGKPNPWHKTAR